MTSPRPRTRLRAVACLLAVLAAAAAWLVLRPEPSAAPPRVTETGPVLAPTDIVDTAAQRASSDADTPMPPPATPLPQLVAALSERARQGHAHAACRIAVETLACDVAWTIFRARQARDALFSTRSERYQDELDRHDLAVAEQVARCGPVSDAQRAEAGRLLADAAHRGNVTAALLYVDGAHLHGGAENNYHAFLSHPGFDRWRAEAPVMVERLHRQGVWEASMLLQIAYGGQFSLLGGLVPDDPERALAHRLLLSRLRGAAEPPMPKEPPDRVQAARELAEGWHRNYYGGRVGFRGPGRGAAAIWTFSSDRRTEDFCAP